MINEPESLRQIAEKEIECLTVLEELENERVLLFDIIAPGLTLEDWLDRSNDDLSDVKKLAITLKENFIKLRELNDINMELMKESLAFVQFSLNVLIGDDTPVTYGKASSQLARRSVIDKRFRKVLSNESFFSGIEIARRTTSTTTIIRRSRS